MRAFATHRRWALLLFAALSFAATRAGAQGTPGNPIDPTWDHYKVYDVEGPPGLGVPGGSVILQDQFAATPHTVLQLRHLMNPTEKDHAGVLYPINDPITHYTWWAITPASFSTLVVAVNQFGDQTLAIYDAEFLLNPALKNQQGPLPVENHYKCYRCQGQPVNRPVVLHDQFGPWQANVLFPRYFCNPTEKRVPASGAIYPIVDPKQHYVCYDFEPIDPRTFTPYVLDQFLPVPTDVVLVGSRMLCVPTHKESATATDHKTWGRLKQLYR
jgi:hypothetical protein